ncbi:MAG: hypothetical protein GC154_15610 [bacterium]|nr:hypothetical protein [bacterium]
MDELPVIQTPDLSELSAALSENRPSWDEYFMLLAKLAATRSTCFSRPVGAAIAKDKRLLATGYNGAPPGAWHCIDKKQCYWRQPENQTPGIEPRELSRAVHAEMNAIAHAARNGIAIEGASIYVTMSPCVNCFKVLLSAGIKRVFFEHIYDFNNNGGDKFLLDYYKQYADLAEVTQLKIGAESQRISNEFINEITSKRRHDHY